MEKLNTANEYYVILNRCRQMVLDNMKESGLIEKWDGLPTCVTPEQHLNNIVKWCNENIKSYVWSNHKSNKCGFRTSYGAKHKCEKDLQCYVANNWMKLAMILSGLEVCCGDCIDFETGKVYNKPVSFQDILTNSVSFICRRKMYANAENMHLNCIYPYVPEELKYIA